MNILSRIFKTKQKETIDSQYLFKNYLKFAEIITFSDKIVLEQLTKLFTDTNTFLAENSHHFENRDIDVANEHQEIIYLIAFVDILIENGYAEEFDWKCLLEDFEYLLMDLKQFKYHFSSCQFPQLDETDELPYWAGIINSNWQKHQVAIMSIDIDSDSYVLFPVSVKYIEYLEEHSNNINQTISLFEI